VVLPQFATKEPRSYALTPSPSPVGWGWESEKAKTRGLGWEQFSRTANGEENNNQ